jgi:hypothetical protein
MNLLRDIFNRAAGTIGPACLGLLIATPLLADSLRIIELVDGSRIAGEIVLFEHGVYTIESDSLGRLHIPNSDIQAIRAAGHATPRQPSPAATDTASAVEPQLPPYESQMLADPAIVSMVMTLQQDPDVLAVLNDPSVMQAIAARDFDALQGNAKILKLENNPTIRQILDIVGRR